MYTTSIPITVPSQSCVATTMRLSSVCNEHFTANFLLSVTVKIFQNRSISTEDMNYSLVCCIWNCSIDFIDFIIYKAKLYKKESCLTYKIVIELELWSGAFLRLGRSTCPQIHLSPQIQKLAGKNVSPYGVRIFWFRRTDKMDSVLQSRASILGGQGTCPPPPQSLCWGGDISCIVPPKVEWRHRPLAYSQH